MSQADKFTINLGGEQITLNISEQEREYVLKLADYVNDIFAYLKRNSKKSSLTKIALLAAFNITDELFQLKAENEKLKKKYYHCEQEKAKYIEKIRNLAKRRDT